MQCGHRAGKPAAVFYELRSLAVPQLKNFSGAVDDLTNAMALRPGQVALLSQRGWLYIIADAPRFALHDFDAAILLDPSAADLYNGRGSARLSSGEHREAVADAEKALSLGKPSSESSTALQGSMPAQRLWSPKFRRMVVRAWF